MELARKQHREYVAALVDAGVEVEILRVDSGHPDGCFVEDAAILLGEMAIMTRPGAPSRRAEVGPLEGPLAAAHVLTRLEAPATLEGGDVLRLGARLVVGRSRRTNAAGIEALRQLAAPVGVGVVAVDVPRGLHLKSACSALDEQTVVIDPEALPPASLEALGLTVCPVPEARGANVLAFGDRTLVSASAPRTARWLRARGHRVIEVTLEQFHRGDGALSCLSLRMAPAGAWSV